MSSEGSTVVVTVDRVEGEYAVVVDGERQVDIPMVWLPDGVSEGAVLRLEFAPSPDDETALRERVEQLQRRLRGSTEGDTDP